jgi:hypothetical protein
MPGVPGFDTIFRGTQQQQVVERTLIHGMESRFVAAQVGEVGGGGEFFISGCDAAHFDTFGFGRSGGIEEVILDGPIAAYAPRGGRHLLHYAHLDVVEGAEAIHVKI